MAKIKRNTRVGTLVAATAAMALLVPTVAFTGAASADTGRRDIRVVVLERPPEHVVDEAPTGMSAGDTLLFDEPVVNPKTGERIGTAVTRVQIVKTLAGDDALFILDCTVRLPRGNLVFTAAEQFSHLASGVTFVVAGGTGRFAGADGTVTGRHTEFSGEPAAVLSFDLTRG
jgi:hypothetical protein